MVSSRGRSNTPVDTLRTGDERSASEGIADQVNDNTKNGGLLEGTQSSADTSLDTTRRQKSTRKAAINGKRLMKMEIENPWGYNHDDVSQFNHDHNSSQNTRKTGNQKSMNHAVDTNDDQLRPYILRDPSQFEEPPLADPLPGVTGQPLELPPPDKLKKEYIKKSKAKLSQISSSPSPSSLDSNESDKSKQTRSASPPIKNGQREVSTSSLTDESENDAISIETNYRSQLNTQVSEGLVKPSDIRESTDKTHNTIPKPGSEELDVAEENGDTKGEKIEGSVPSTPTKRKQDESVTKKTNKRVKGSPKKKENLFLQSLLAADGTNSIKGDTNSKETGDSTIMNEDFCSSCGYPGIFLCCEGCPKSFHFLCCDPPIDEDNLPSDSWFCRECLAKTNKTPKYNVGIFSKLLNQAEMRNPRAFTLPKKMREVFEGVHTGPFGEYQDNNLKPVKSYKQIKSSELDPENIYDKDGKPYFCYKCGGSGLDGKTITTCDYCPLSWHIDCVSPPLTGAKTIGTKWKCPNHVDGFVKSKRKLKRQPIVEVDMSRGFSTDADDMIEIVNESENDDSMVDDSSLIPESLVVALPEPAYLSGWENTETGINYPMGRELSKLKKSKFKTYRIKERSIVLDFIENSHAKRQEEIESIDRENSKLITSVNGELKGYIESVCRLSQRDLLTPQRREINLRGLLDLVEDEIKVEEEEIGKDELKELLMIKRLMKVKGHDALLQFLKSE